MEDFVTFELAKKLKEKGFREKCLLYYESTGGFFSNCIDTYYRPNQELDYSDFLKCFNEGNSIGLIDAPTISQVLKWLREEKQIHINTSVYKDESEDADGRIIEEWCFWNWDILNCNSGDVLQDGDDIEYESYEQAAVAGIEYVLDNLI